MTKSALSDIKVLDLSQGIAGPYCTKLLAAFGAEVIKVEKPNEGDFSRTMGPFPNDECDGEKSGTFIYLNLNKKSVTLNLTCEKGIAICKRMLERSDILVESFPPGYMAKLGLSSEILREINPRLNVTSISAYGQTGPYRNYESNNLTSYAMGGAMYVMRPGTNPKERPAIEGGFQAEYSTGVLSYIATIAALMERIDAGGGRSLDLSMMECVVSTLMGHVAEYSYLGFSRRTNPFAIHGYPIGYSVPCEDGWISLTPGIGGAPNIPFLMGRPELHDDPLFTETRTRMAETGKFDALISPWLLGHKKWEIAQQAQELKLAFTPVLSLGELPEDQQLVARQFFREVDYQGLGEVTCPGSPAKFSDIEWRMGKAPTLGEHNREIYGGYGFTERKLAKMQAEGVV